MDCKVNSGYSVVTPEKTYLPGETLELEGQEGDRLINAGIVKEVKASEAKALNATETIALIQQANLAELEAISMNEARKTVVEAIAKRRAELTEPA